MQIKIKKNTASDDERRYSYLLMRAPLFEERYLLTGHFIIGTIISCFHSNVIKKIGFSVGWRPELFPRATLPFCHFLHTRALQIATSITQFRQLLAL